MLDAFAGGDVPAALSQLALCEPMLPGNAAVAALIETGQSRARWWRHGQHGRLVEEAAKRLKLFEERVSVVM